MDGELNKLDDTQLNSEALDTQNKRNYFKQALAYLLPSDNKIIPNTTAPLTLFPALRKPSLPTDQLSSDTLPIPPISTPSSSSTLSVFLVILLAEQHQLIP